MVARSATGAADHAGKDMERSRQGEVRQTRQAEHFDALLSLYKAQLREVMPPATRQYPPGDGRGDADPKRRPRRVWSVGKS